MQVRFQEMKAFTWETINYSKVVQPQDLNKRFISVTVSRESFCAFESYEKDSLRVVVWM